MDEDKKDDNIPSQNERTEEYQADGNLNNNQEPETNGSLSKYVQTNTLSIDLIPQKSILKDETNHSFSESHGKSVSLDVESSDSGMYNFYRNYSNNADLSKTNDFLFMIIPPDGGYAWVIFGASFLSQVIVEGILYSIGVLLPYIALEMALSNKQTALVASTQLGTYCITAPVGSAFINKFGFRIVAVIGLLLASAALFVASFSQEIVMLVFFYGIIAGPAMGFAGVSSSLIINYYFERLRAVVGGVASSGSGVGIVCISLFNVTIVDNFGWRIALRLHVVLLLIAGLLVCTYRELKPIQIGHFVKSITDEDSDEGTIISTELASEKYSLFTPSELRKSTSSTQPSGKNVESITIYQRCCPWCTQKNSASTIDDNRVIISYNPLDRNDIYYSGPPKYTSPIPSQTSGLKNGVFVVKDERLQTVSYSLSVMRKISRTVTEDEKCACIPKQMKSALFTLFDLQLLNMSEVWLMMLVALLFPMGYNIPYVYSIQRAQIDDSYANLLPTIIGLTNIISRISMGFVVYKLQFNPAYLAGIGMTFGGVVTFLSAFIGQESEVFQMTFACCFGIGAASFFAVRAVIYVNALGLERLTNAFGLSTMFTGVGVFFGTNIAGYLNDLFPDFSVTFIFSGACMAIAGLVEIFIPSYMEYRRKLEANRVKRKVRFARDTIKQKWWRKCF